MSTYTDLKNRVKETITVGFRPEDRVTTQKVRFYNEENQYWGSLSGNIAGSINVYGGGLSSVDIYDATLIDPAVKTSNGTVIKLGAMSDQFEDLSAGTTRQLSALSGVISGVNSGTVSAIEKMLPYVTSEEDVTAKISAMVSCFMEIRDMLCAQA